jgi:hypothetical protein
MMGSIWCIRDRVGSVWEGVGAVSEEKWAVVLWLRRRYGCDVCPRERRNAPTKSKNSQTIHQP